ncbi:efflux RND transporter periplasmic adaptor subunit [Methylophilus medardicus]|uniref:Efflux RND transporter periplasmic adaptor subunit n=1 Tax=Methylophilus medardicus TaxID=2588534 RepID=A0A5B8CU64_9PROT|nr:efflux RND transporter periplasmic adaptor subunit [Methylophilus medardicus]QDC44793.1 efflux RND transporter periplasmic adaptor subunit [Methylophilus medardicus]QDC49800.1 efflux RND transporter periplasmic adaptor subunit [Methylophilus medardicus]QDC53505.1 efflux RND transporter periplasmic adaptor subunit [Methylophilus medardicus]
MSNSTAGVSRGLKLGSFLLLLAAIGAVVVGMSSRASHQTKLKDWTDKQAVATVTVNPPTNGAVGGSLVLPGRFEAYARAPIYARVSGYLKGWKVDIGGSVKSGQLLAEIETPDLDQELLQARADLASAQATVALAETTAKRWQDMWKTQSIARQEVDEKLGDYQSKKALVNAAEANVNRLLALKRFARIEAPFDGAVTTRNTDTGALINAGSNASTTLPLFEVSNTRKLRLYTHVPQNYVSHIKAGGKAQFSVPELPEAMFEATIQSTSGAITASSGTTLVQLLVDNTAGRFLPGGFANVDLALNEQTGRLSIPASALIFDQNGMKVATVNQQHQVVLKTITIARDLGKTLEVQSGLLASDQVIENPPDGISDGVRVNLATAVAPR